MTRRRHKHDTRTFAELTYGEQAKFITAMINNLQKAIFHHINHVAATRRDKTRRKCLGQVSRLLGRLINRV